MGESTPNIQSLCMAEGFCGRGLAEDTVVDTSETIGGSKGYIGGGLVEDAYQAEMMVPS